MSQSPSRKGIFKTADGTDYTVLFMLVTSLFILWGFCNGMIDVLNKHFQNSLQVSKTQSALVQFANYMGYFVMALPAGMIARRWGYKGGILTGLFLIAAGAFWFIPATQIGTYWAFLTGLFILAAGMTCLETIANPYATLLGDPETGAARINLAQTCNGVGWILGPLVGGRFVLSSTGEINTSNAGLYVPYLGIGIIVTILMLIFFFSKVPDIKAGDDYQEEHLPKEPAKSIWTHPHFVLAVVAQFFYVAAQTGVFSFFINFIVADAPLLSQSLASLLPKGWTVAEGDLFKITELGSSRLLGLGGFGLFLTGRFVGSMVLRYFKAHSVLGLFAIANVAMMILTVLPLGWLSVFGLFMSFFFMSLMFPTIFALGIHGLGDQTKKAASYIVMAIVGGAIMPLLMGWLADHYGMRLGFVVPLGCFGFVAFYGMIWGKLSKPHLMSRGVVASH